MVAAIAPTLADAPRPRLHGVQEKDFRLQVDDRSVPAAVWLPADATDPRPLLLVGHGGTGHKKADPVLDLVRRLVQEQGFVVAAIDGPVHGDRRAAPASPEAVRDEFRAAWDRTDTIAPMVADWRALLDWLCALPAVDPTAIAYYGISMGTAYGLPLVAEEPRIRRAVLGMWGLSRKHSDRLLAAAGRIRCPLLFLQQWHDQRFSREHQATLFDAFAAEDRRMYVYPGDHADPDATRLDDIVHFLTAAPPFDRRPFADNGTPS
jgi:dienelactone hydrolase